MADDLFRGYRTLLNCPICARQVLTFEQAQYLTNAIHSGNLDLAEAYLSLFNSRLLMLEPAKLETLQLTSHRMLIAPLCKNHGKVGFNKLERQVLLASVFAERL